jgi:L-iditol 2-dehydrogenase
MLEPLGVALHALDLGHVRLGATAAVAGCGPIGLLLIQALRAAGASSVTAFDPLAHRRAAALRFGAVRALDPADIRTDVDLRDAIAAARGEPGGAGEPGGSGEPGGAGEPDGREGADGTDVAFEIAGTNDAVRLAMRCARPGGRVVLGGIPATDETAFPASLARRKGLTIAMVRRMNDTYPRAISLANSGVVTLTPLVTDIFGLAVAADALASAASRRGLKVLVAPAA